MTHPDGFRNIGEIARTIQDVLIGMVREFLMLQRIDMLDVEQEQVRVVHQLLEFAEERLSPSERLSAGVDTGVYAALLRLLEKLRQEVDLEQRFSTAHGDATIFSPIGAIAFGFGEELFGRHLLPLSNFPRVGILTIAAAHAATLKENDETDAWSVNRTERFRRMNVTCHIMIKPSPLHLSRIERNAQFCFELIRSIRSVGDSNKRFWTPPLMREMEGTFPVLLFYKFSCAWRAITSSCCSRVRSMNFTAYPLTRMVKLAYSSFSGCSIASRSLSTPKTFTLRWCAPRSK